MNKLAVILDKIDPTQHPFLVRYLQNLELALQKEWTLRGFSYQKPTTSTSNSVIHIDDYNVLNILRSLGKYFFNNDYPLKDYFRHDLIALFHPDIIHFTNPNRYLKATKLISNLNIRKVVSFRGSDILVFPQTKSNWERTLKLIFKEADILHFNCIKLKEEAINLGANTNKCRVIYRSIDPDFVNNVRNRYQDGLKLQLLSVGRLVWQKNHFSTLRAVQILKKTGIAVHLTIVGDGELRDQLMNEVRTTDLVENVTFKGKLNREELEQEFKKTHLFIQSSVSEGIPNALLESLSMGVPVISTSVGGIPEVIKNNKTGFIVPEDDPDVLADKIISIYRNDELLDEVVKNGQKTVNKDFRTETEIQNWTNLFNELKSS